MLFKDLKPGYPVYILDRSKMAATTGKATNISPSHLQQKGVQTNMQMVVDVSIDDGGDNKTYEIPDTLSVTYAGDVVLSTDRDGILREVEAIKAKSAEVVASVDKNRAIIESCDVILQNLNPDLADKKRQEERITGLEGKIDKIEGMLSRLIQKFDS